MKKEFDIIGLLNTKKIYSRFSNKPIVFVEEITQDIIDKGQGVYSDGMTLLDFVEDAEDDISNMYCVLKTGHFYNMEDFYAEYGAFEDAEVFFENLKNLIADK